MATLIASLSSHSPLVSPQGLVTPYFKRYLDDLWLRTGGATSGLLLGVNNLSDLTNIAIARTNLGLGSAALLASSSLLLVSNNLSDLSNVTTARSNLGLGTLATQAASNVAITGGTAANLAITNSSAALTTGSVIPGGASSVANVGGVINVNTTSVSNVSTTETNLITYSLPANALATNGQSIEVIAWGTFAATANNKTVRIYFGSTIVLDTGAVAANSGNWMIRMTVIRTGAATQLAMATFISDNTTEKNICKTASPVETLSGAVTIKVTGIGGASSDITQLAMQTLWQQAA